jgi:hypothetical protein
VRSSIVYDDRFDVKLKGQLSACTSTYQEEVYSWRQRSRPQHTGPSKKNLDSDFSNGLNSQVSWLGLGATNKGSKIYFKTRNAVGSTDTDRSTCALVAAVHLTAGPYADSV